MPDSTVPKEITLSAAWHAGAFGDAFTTVSGETVQIVHRGAWSHGLGPDFKDAMILVAGRELRAGDIEIHLQTRGWLDHGHARDPAYDNVVLHVVARHDGSETRLHNGLVAPVIEVGFPTDFPSPPMVNWDWNRVGGAVCATKSAIQHPERIKAVLDSLGDLRMAQRSARIEARLSSEPPAEILWGEILDGLGFSRNRAPMRRLAALLPVSALQELLLALPESRRLVAAQGLLLGAAGFLPLSPSDAHLGAMAPRRVEAIEASWARFGAPWNGEVIPATAWDMSRTRPANHPVPRLLAASSLVANCLSQGGVFATLADLFASGSNLAADLGHLTSSSAKAGIGKDRALDILASGIIPALLAIAMHSGDDRLAEAVAHYWDALPASSPNSVTKRAISQVVGRASLRNIGARGSQGLIHLDTTLCQTRRCFECPIAALELAVND